MNTFGRPRGVLGRLSGFLMACKNENCAAEDNAFDKALAINSMPVWPDAVAGLREMRHVMKAGGKIALGFTLYSGRSKDRVCDLLTTAGFANTRVVESERGFCTLASKP
jgi:hypothetical protein